MSIIDVADSSVSAMVDPPTLSESHSKTASSHPKNGVTGRRRALSIAEAKPSVETVVAKAKRAAQSLWMLLHAQVRNLSAMKEKIVIYASNVHTAMNEFSNRTSHTIFIAELCFGSKMSASWLPRGKIVASSHQDL
jgi:hypothetical protein